MKTSPRATPKITPEIRSRLIEQLQSPIGFSSYGQIMEWIEQEFHLKVKYKTVYCLVHYELKAKLKVPRPVSKNQDEFAISLLKKTFP